MWPNLITDDDISRSGFNAASEGGCNCSAGDDIGSDDNPLLNAAGDLLCITIMPISRGVLTTIPLQMVCNDGVKGSFEFM